MGPTSRLPRRARAVTTAALAAIAAAALPSAAQAATEIVKPSSPGGWITTHESTPGGTAGFVAGPATAPGGSGSANLRLTSSAQGMILAKPTAPFRFADVTTLGYSTFRASADAGNNLAVALQFVADYDRTDSDDGWQGRLVFEPYRTPASVPQNTWQSWDAMAGEWFATGAPGNTVCPSTNPCTWTQLLTAFPEVGAADRPDSAIILKAGSGWATFNGNVDNLTIGVAGDETTYDFEPEVQCAATCYVDAAGGDDAFGGSSPDAPKKTIQAALNQVGNDGTVHVAAGTYNEDVRLNKPGVDVIGAGIGETTVVGPIGGSFNTFEVSAAAQNALVEGFTITRAGNAPATWTSALNNQGFAIYGKGTTIRENEITGNRNGIYVGGSSAQNVTFERNVIDFNRTGLHVVNDVTGLVVRNNFLTNNWTMGLLIRDELGTNPNPTGAITVEDNDISGNWYSQVEARSKFNPGTTFDVEGNWLGSDSAPVAVGAPTSYEEGYATQIPLAFGGSSVAPLAPLTGTIVWNDGLNAANPVDASPWLCSGDDADAGATGFQPAGALPGTHYRDLDGDGLGDAGSTTEACSLPAGYAANSDDTNDDPDRYELSAFQSPIDMAVANAAKAGQNVPVKLRILDSTGAPVTTDPGLDVIVDSVSCGGTGSADLIETYAAQSSGWNHLGDGVWQLNWKTLKSMAGGCRTLTVDVNDATDGVSALFALK